MWPIIGKSAVVPHIIIRVCSIEAVAAIVDGILRHLPLVIVRSVKEESCGVWQVDDIFGSGRKAGSVIRKEGAALD